LIARLAAVVDAIDRILDADARGRVARWGLLLTFAMVTTQRVIGTFRFNTFAIDLRVYRAAAEAALAGGDPWAVRVDGIPFAAPPPTVLAYLPAALLPEGVATVLYGAVMLAAAVIAIRAVRLPLWWLLFPPISESLIVLNPDVLVVALLVAFPRFASLSVVLKVYAAVPLALSGRWRALAGGLLLCLLSAPLWPAFLAAGSSVQESFVQFTYGGTSAWGTWLMVPTVLALVVLYRRGAEWLAVPAVWPYTQLHYAAVALPVAARNPVVAFLLAFPVALFPPIATIYYAAYVVISGRLAAYRSGAASTEPSTST
jgi:hypothetical protein